MFADNNMLHQSNSKQTVSDHKDILQEQYLVTLQHYTNIIASHLFTCLPTYIHACHRCQKSFETEATAYLQINTEYTLMLVNASF